MIPMWVSCDTLGQSCDGSHALPTLIAIEAPNGGIVDKRRN